MSKKKKVSGGKAVKKTAAKKPVKTSSKSAAKKPEKKAAKPAPKKPVTKSAKKPNKAVKPAPKKIVPAKKAAPAKKIAKPIAKKASKPVAAKKSGKPADKKALKAAPKPLTKVAPKPVLSKKAEKKPELKKPAPSPAKATAPSKVSKPEPAPKAAIATKDTKSKSTTPVASLYKADEPARKTAGDRKGSDVLAITNTIPVAPKHEIPMSKIVSISHSITNPIRKTDSYAVKAEKEPAGKFEMEFVLHSSAEMLYEFLSTASGLSEWFCDDLNIRNGIYTFIWDDQLQQARLLKTVELQVVRFQWVDKTDGSYFEFRIQKDDLTNDIALIITDFADSVSERESSKLLWTSQIEKLRHVIGSIF